jgi:hypothetical protein
VDGATRRPLGWHLGSRSDAGARKLVEKIDETLNQRMVLKF